MEYKKSLLDEFKANKIIFNSSDSTERKSSIFRNQIILLDEITKNSPESDRLSMLRSHFKEGYDSENYSKFIGNRTSNIKQLLSCPPKHDISLSCDTFLKENKILLEPLCSGEFESSLKDQVKESDLKIFSQCGKSSSTEQLQLKPNSIVSKTLSKPISQIGCEFRTAREELIIQNMKKNGDSSASSSSSQTFFNYGATKKSLGARGRNRPFVNPVRQEDNVSPRCTPPDVAASTSNESIDERLRNIDPKMIELISNEIMHKYKPIEWDDIAGLEYAKATIKEAVVWPMLRPDIFTGLRRPPRGILLFGPPGTGKTLIGKCIASQSKATFFSISASSLTSKWVGDGEKMVRALFAVAAVNQPSVVFIDEIDSLLSQRSETEHESSRRLKTEFLVQLDGACTTDDERILIVGATNRPQELDEAARRRLVRRLYIPLPELQARITILTNLLKTVRNNITEEEVKEVGNLTDGYSGADMETLCREASMEPIRSIPPDEIPFFDEKNVRPVEFNDFRMALVRVRPSVTHKDLQQYSDWNKVYGAGQ